MKNYVKSQPAGIMEYAKVMKIQLLVKKYKLVLQLVSY
jgi:hypothetical protein